MALKIITGPAAEPVTLSEAKSHLRVEHSTDDTMITTLIQVARSMAEKKLGGAIINQTWELVLDSFPDAEIKLDFPPVSSIESVKYIDGNGDQQTISSANYTLDGDTMPGWVLPAYGYSWPATIDAANAVRVRFIAGYGASGDSVPEPIKQWILLTVGTMYAQRETVSGFSLSEMPRTFYDAMLDPYRWWEVA